MPNHYPESNLKTLAAILYAFLVSLAFCSNITLAIIFWVGHRHFSQKLFYIVAKHLLIADFLLLTSQLFIAVPVSIMSPEMTRVYESTKVYEYFVTMETVGHVATFNFVLLQSLTQVAPFLPRNEDIIIQLSSVGTFICMFVWFLNTEKLNDTSRTVWILLKIWLGATLFFSFLIYVIGLKTVFQKHRMQNNSTIEQSNSSNTVSNRKTNNELRRSRSILMQGMLVVLFTVVCNIEFFSFRSLDHSTWFTIDTVTSLTILCNCLSIICTGSRLFVYLLFNKLIAKLCAKMWYLHCRISSSKNSNNHKIGKR